MPSVNLHWPKKKTTGRLTQIGVPDVHQKITRTPAETLKKSYDAGDQHCAKIAIKLTKLIDAEQPKEAGFLQYHLRS